MILVVLEPAVKIVGAAGLDDLVIQGADNARLDDLDLGNSRLIARHAPRHAADAAKTTDAPNTSDAAEIEAAAKAAHPKEIGIGRHQFGLRKLPLRHEGEHGEFLEEIAGHLVQLGLAWGRDDHAEVVGPALELRLDGEGFDFGLRVPGEKDFLTRLLHVLLL